MKIFNVVSDSAVVRVLSVVAIVVVSCAQSVLAETPDKFIRYVESTGQQAVDTGITARYNTSAQMKFEWTNFTALDVGFLGARASGSTDSRIYFCHRLYSKVSAGYGGFFQWSYWWETNRVYDVKTEFSEVTVDSEQQTYCKMMVGSQCMWSQTNSVLVNTGINIYLFAHNVAGTPMYHASTRCYGLKIWQDGDLVRDFRPCVKDSRVGLYDAVSENIFYSTTGTDLVWDENDDVPDEFIDCVETRRNTYVDTGVIGRSGTKAEADIVWLRNDGDDAVLCARGTYSGNDRIMLIHNYKSAGIGYGDFIYMTDYGSYLTNTRYKVVSELKAGSQTLVINGETVYSGDSESTYNTGRNLYLFANNRGGTLTDKSYVRLYNLKIWQDDVLVRDYRPCRKNGIPALYDAVEERIFYGENENLEPELTPSGRPDCLVEYLQADGTVHLDTGVPARYGTRAAGEVLWNEVDWDQWGTYMRDQIQRDECCFLGARWDVKRFLMFHEYRAKLWAAYGEDRLHPPGGDAGDTPLEAGHKYSFDIYYGDGSQTLYLDGVQLLGTNWNTVVDADCNLYLFACNSRGRADFESKTRCYGLKLWQDGNLVRDFVPCVKDGKGMMWDTVTKKLYRPNPDIIATTETVGATTNVWKYAGLIIEFR